VLDVNRKALRYRSKRTDDPVLRGRVKEIAARDVRFEPHSLLTRRFCRGLIRSGAQNGQMLVVIPDPVKQRLNQYAALQNMPSIMEVTSDTMCGTCGKPLLHCGHVMHCECDCACIELCDPAHQRVCDLCLSDDHDGDERGIRKIN
jgi:hypothetical protein